LARLHAPGQTKDIERKWLRKTVNEQTLTHMEVIKMKLHQLLKKLISHNLNPPTSNQNQEVFKMKPTLISQVPSIFNLFARGGSDHVRKPLTLISKRNKAMKTEILKGEDTKSERSPGVRRRRRPLLLTDLKLWVLAMLFFFLASISAKAGLKSESTEEVTGFAPGVMMVKFSGGVKVEMEKKEGYIGTRILCIDALNRKYGVREFIKVFSPEPKSEKGRTAYRELGLGRVYRFVTLPEADVQAMVAEYEADPDEEIGGRFYSGKICCSSRILSVAELS
jgi:hypothetical protein